MARPGTAARPGRRKHMPAAMVEHRRQQRIAERLSRPPYDPRANEKRITTVTAQHD